MKNYLDWLANIYGTDKRIGIHGYTREYNNMFDRIRTDVRKMCEIGIYTGASICMWRDYFPVAVIYGIDTMQPYIDSMKMEERIVSILGDATKPETWNTLPTDFDIIIDDSSHIPSEQLQMFELGIEHVKSNGFYIIEDIHVAFSQGGADLLLDYFRARIADNQIFGYSYGDFYEAVHKEGHRMSKLAKSILSIKFLKSMIVIEKA